MFDDPKENNNNDEFVDSSFMVSFKANESTSVSDKIKEGNSLMDDMFKDEFDDFEFDPNKSAFKPLNSATVTPKTNLEPTPPVTPFSDMEVPKANDSVFTDADLDFNAFTNKEPDNKADDNIFAAGLDLDFATSSASSPFAPKKEEINLDININNETAVNKVSVDNAKTTEPKPTVSEAGNIKTYGKVSSGVNAFARPSSQPEASPVIKDEKKVVETTPSPFVNNNQQTKEETPSPFVNNQVKEEVKPSPFVNNQPKSKPESSTQPVNKQEKPSEDGTPYPFVKKGEANKTVPTSNTARVAPASKSAPAKVAPKAPLKAAPKSAVATTRPGESTSSKVAPKSSSHSANANIAPVQVNKKQSKKMAKADKPVKEPGKGGLIGLIAVLGAIFVLLWVADNYKNWFGDKGDTTAATTQVTAVATTESNEAIIETTIENTETTTGVTEETTVVTEVETSETSESSDATVETTEETTTATTTTEATTEATTTRAPSTSNEEIHARYTITNPRATSDGFHFDLAVTNTGNNTFSVSQLDHLDISFSTSSTITSLTSDYFTFTPGSEPNSFVGTPRSGSFPAGETTNCTITATTENTVQHFYISTYHFEWN